MASLGKLWHKMWFSELDPYSIGMFRIFLGLEIVLFYLCLFPNWSKFYAPDGIAGVQTAGGEFLQEDWWSVFYWTREFLPVEPFWWLGVGAAIAFTLGYRTRLATVVLFVLECSLLHRSLMAMNGEDVVFRMLLLYGMFAPLGHCLSLDALRTKRQSQTQERPLPWVWPVRLMQINFLLIYVISLPNKIADDIAWLDGDAIYLAMVSNQWSRGFFPELYFMFDGLFSKMITYGTMVVEGLAPICIWLPKTRWLAILALAGLHTGIAILLNGVAFFSMSMVVALWIFVPPECSRKLVKRLRHPWQESLAKVH